RQQSVLNVVLEILEVHSLAGNGLFQIFHAGEFVVGADGVEPFNKLRLYTHSHVFGALDEEGLVDEVATSVFLAIFGGGLRLFRGAAILAFGFGVFYGGVARLLVFGARDDFIVDA